jgi:hypothetical protein
MGKEWGGGGQFTSNLGPGWTRIAPHRKEGFQVSKRDSVAKGVIKGNWQGELTRGVNRELHHMLHIVILYICIMLCVNMANKKTVFRL